jgi:type 1 fimbria pilin
MKDMRSAIGGLIKSSKGLGATMGRRLFLSVEKKVRAFGSWSDSTKWWLKCSCFTGVIGMLSNRTDGVGFRVGRIFTACFAFYMAAFHAPVANAQVVTCPGPKHQTSLTLPSITISNPDLRVGAVVSTSVHDLPRQEVCSSGGLAPEIAYGVWADHPPGGSIDLGIEGLGVYVIFEGYGNRLAGIGSNEIDYNGVNRSMPNNGGTQGIRALIRVIVTSPNYKNNVGTQLTADLANISHINLGMVNGAPSPGDITPQFRQISLASSPITFNTLQTCTLSDVSPPLLRVSAVDFIGADRVRAGTFRVKKICGAGAGRSISYTITDALSPLNNTTTLLKSPADLETGVRIGLVRPGLTQVRLGEQWFAHSSDPDLELAADYVKVRDEYPTSGEINSKATIRLDYP